MKVLKIILLATIICLETFKSNAQNISGNVVDERRQPLSFANIVLLKADSTYAGSAIADDNGTFSIPHHQDAKYLNISYMGYVSQYWEITADSIVTIQMHPDTQMVDMDDPHMAGMVKKIAHLLKIEEI